MPPVLELDPRWFTVLAASPTAVLVKHNTTGTLGLFKLEWRDRGAWPATSEAEAWTAYLSAQQT